jgi:HEAT repeat protein
MPRPAYAQTFPITVVLAFAAAGMRAQAPAKLDLAADLKSRSIEVRLKAIDQVATSGRPDAEALLAALLDDKDWEVQERTAAALGRMQAKTAIKGLVDVAIEGDVARVREAAAAALGAIDAAAASAAILKKARGKTQVQAQEALALVNRRQPGLPDAEKALKKLLRDPSGPMRESAAAAWLECATNRADALRALLVEPFAIVRCRALDAVAAAPRADDLAPLLEALAGPLQNDVVERRLVRAVAAVVAAAADPRAAATAAIDAAHDRAGDKGHVMVRRARLAPLLARGEKAPLAVKDAVAAAATALTHAERRPRAAAARALRELGGAEALAAALARFGDERDGRVRLQLVETVAALRPPTTPEAVAWLADVLARDEEALVRERAAVRLGAPKVAAAGSLAAATNDSDWAVACCAAVSLGKTGDDAALAPLVKLLQHQAWTRRGAAVVGLMHWNREGSLEPLFGALADPHPIVARAAHEALRTMSLRLDIAQDQKAWRAWWEQNKQRHVFSDRRQSIEKQKKYGYAVPDAEIYQGLDVIVLVSRGDHIEQLLKRLEIAHRETQANHVADAGVHPEAIFVANCTGEIEAGDVEPLAWFVRTGGSLFGSCWALHETIEKIHAGVVRKFETPAGEVMDDVRARPCRPESPLLNGVFPPGVVPIYHLEGAHLIEVLDPEQAEVLIDSPDAAERHGSGNLAAWFFSGHGVILDSANHFDLQGLEVAQGLKTERERQAYAVDHMGLTYETWRATQREAYWKASPRASKSVPDLSAFRFLTNFVRSKRMGEY